MAGALCTRCGGVLDRVLLDLGWDRHLRCLRDSRADDAAYRAAMAAIANTFPLARRITNPDGGAK